MTSPFSPHDNPQGFDQRSMSGSVPLGSSDDVIEARIVDVLATMRDDLTKRGTSAPYSAPPLPTNFAPQRYGDYLKIARYSDDGLRIVVQVVLDIEHKPWYIGVRADAFETGAALETQNKDVA